MVTRDADVIKKGDNYYLELTLTDQKVDISLTEDHQNEVKEVFNKLILALKKEKFEFRLVNEKNDLYYQISKEYLSQLNLELDTVYTELKSNNFLEDELYATAEDITQ